MLGDLTIFRSSAPTYWGIFALMLIGAMASVAPRAAADTIIIQSTTSTQNSGLYRHILPSYTADTGNVVRVVAVGTGQAIKNAANCDGDLLLVHSKADEEKFVASGYGIRRDDVMYNDFVVIGPDDDPASIAASTNINEVLNRIAQAEMKFVSRGDDSGTHKAEMRFWAGTSIDPSLSSGQWYIETGQGMGGTLNVAVELDGYVISDRSTWITFANRGRHRILFAGDSHLFNQYGVVVVNPAKCPQVYHEKAQAFADWILSARGQAVIDSYQVNGQQLFFANAKDRLSQ